MANKEERKRLRDDSGNVRLGGGQMDGLVCEDQMTDCGLWTDGGAVAVFSAGLRPHSAHRIRHITLMSTANHGRSATPEVDRVNVCRRSDDDDPTH